MSGAALYCPGCGHRLSMRGPDRCSQCGFDVMRARDRARNHYRRLKRRCVWIVVAVFVGAAAIDGIAPVFQGAAGLLPGVTMGLATLAWCRYDGLLHGRSASLLTKFIVVFFLPLGLSIYFLSRGRWRSFGKGILLGLAFSIGITLIGSLTFRLFHGYWGFLADPVAVG